MLIPIDPGSGSGSSQNKEYWIRNIRSLPDPIKWIRCISSKQPAILQKHDLYNDD